MAAAEDAVLPAPEAEVVEDEEEEPTGDDQRALLPSSSRPAAPARSTIVYCIFYLLGMGTLLPWNFFITADSYWNYKFRNTTNSSADAQTDLQDNFFGYLSVASMVPNTLMLTLNAAFGHKIRQQLKLVLSLVVVIVFFILTTVLVPINSDDWQITFFSITMVMVVILNVGSAVFQGGLFGVAAQFPARYLSAVISGQALGAVFACVARIVSIAVSGQDQDAAAVNSALVYFILADVTLVISIASYIWMSRMSFYEYYTALSTAPSTTEDALAPSPVDKAPQISAWAILLKIKWYALSVFLVYSVTLALFPAVTAKIKWIGSGPADQHSVWATNYFVPVCCFLLYNGCDYLGRIAGGFTVWPRKHQWYLVLAMAVVRLAFFPLLMYCNVDHKHLDTVFNSDIYYIAFMTLFGLSNGYLSTLCMIYGPGLVEREEQNTASSMMAAFLGAGLCIGAFLSNASIQII